MNVLITGGGGGIAQAIATHFEKYNFYLPTREELDVTSFFSVREYIKNITDLNLVINNAGALYSSSVKDSDPTAWLNDLRVNLLGPYYVTQEALKKFTDVKIINIASAAAYESYQDWSSYCASKAGVVTFTKCLAKEGVEAYCICPGGVDTPFRAKINISSKTLLDPQAIATLVDDILQKKYTSGDSIVIKTDILEVR